MKWYENVDMLKEILENISKELEEVEYGSRVWYLLTDENNLIKNHLELIAKNQELKDEKHKFRELYEIEKHDKLVLKLENDILENVIREAIKLLSVDGKGTKQQVAKLLNGVLENEN